MRACSQGVADYLKQAGLASRGLIVGYDTRFASEDFASVAAEVASGNEIKVYLAPKASPTPTISFGVITQKAGGAIIITASHNPAIWNGLKFKTESGASASHEITTRIEESITRILATGKTESLPLAHAVEQNRVAYLNLAPAYYRQLSQLVDLAAIRNSRLKVVIDPMYGAGSGYFTKLLSGGSIKFMEINSERRSWNLNTSLKSYIDPRVYNGWGQRVNYDVFERYYPKMLRRKFAWAHTADAKSDSVDNA